MRGASPWAALPRFGQAAFTIFLVSAFASAMLADRPLGDRLVLHPAEFVQAVGWWQPLTANVVFVEGDLGGLVGTFAIQWFVGSPLEAFWGRRRYLLYCLGCGTLGYAVLGLLGLVVDAAMPLAVGGTTPLDLAVVVGFGVVYGRRPLQVAAIFPLSARAMAALVAALSVVAPLARGESWAFVIPRVVAMGCALLITTQPWRRGSSSGKLRQRRPPKKRGHLKVVSPDEPRLLNRSGERFS